jgi:hypothetical protein
MNKHCLLRPIQCLRQCCIASKTPMTRYPGDRSFVREGHKEASLTEMVAKRGWQGRLLVRHCGRSKATHKHPRNWRLSMAPIAESRNHIPSNDRGLLTILHCLTTEEELAGMSTVKSLRLIRSSPASIFGCEWRESLAEKAEGGERLQTSSGFPLMVRAERGP